eukprot:TRINITY_DN16204_c0_g1_i1.p1 TRINITY_DN16204_c0_g1~~TRINITY_DN16204_c0_g1_i1.p1  ORF type:complete len:143 (-),score=13.39 TRINITY_DN16204_c0_g1_i1:36-464(-)
MACLRKSDVGWFGLIGTESVSSFTVRFDDALEHDGKMIGFICKSFDSRTYYANSPELAYSGYYFRLKGTLYSKSGHNATPIKVGTVGKGSTVKMILDKSARTISISVNSDPPVLAFEGVDDKDLFPAVWLLRAGMQVSLIDQ